LFLIHEIVFVKIWTVIEVNGNTVVFIIPTQFNNLIY